MMARRCAATEPTFLTQAHAFYEPTPFCAPMTCGSRILLDSVNVKGNVVARSRSKADCRSSRRSSRTLRSRSLSSLLSLLRQRQMSFRTWRISFNRSSIAAITDAISNLNQPWTTGQSRPSLSKTRMRSHDLAICGHDVKISYQHVLLYGSLSTQEHEVTIASAEVQRFLRPARRISKAATRP